MSAELRHLRSFVTAAEELHFSRAARRLHLTQQALSTHVAQLEAAVGGRLFIRTTREVELSEAGKAMLDPARRALAEADRALADARAAIARAPLTVSVGVVGYAPRVIVAELMRDMSQQGIELVPHEWTFAEQLRRLRDGRLDIALGTVPAPPTTLAAEPIFREHLVAAVPADHELAALDEVPLELLAGVPLVLADPGRHEDWNRYVRDAFRASELEPRVAREAFGSLATAHAILDRGDRCTVLTSLAAATPHPRVVMRPISPRVDWITAIVWNPGGDKAAVDRVVASARALCAEQDWLAGSSNSRNSVPAR